MNEASALMEALTVSLIGMSVVFAFLTCLVLALHALPIFFGKLEAELADSNIKDSLPSDTKNRKKQVAAIAVALHESRKGKS